MWSLEVHERRTPILWPPDVKSQLTGKEPDAGKDRRQQAKRAAEDEMVWWHHRHNGHESEQTLKDSEGQGSLACCSPWGRKASDMTWQLNNNNRDLWLCHWIASILDPKTSINNISWIGIQGKGRFFPENSVLGNCIKPINKINKNIMNAILSTIGESVAATFSLNTSCIFCFVCWIDWGNPAWWPS